MHPQLRSARLYIAQQHSTAQCGAVPCPSFCGAVLCGTVRSFEHIAVVVVPGMIQVPGLCTHCVLVFLLSSVDFPLSVPMPPSPPPSPANSITYCRSERDMNKHTAPRRAISSAQAPLSIIINSIFAPKNRGPLLPAPFTYASVAFFRARA